MVNINKEDKKVPMIKIVYFDEDSASDYLDISAGGKMTAKSEDVKKRVKKTRGKADVDISAKFNWVPFWRASGNLGGGVEASAASEKVLSKTLSNTILTDYLDKADSDPCVVKLRNLRVTAPEGSIAFMKMFTPYMVILKMEDIPFDLTRLDEALADAKGYYELLGEGVDENIDGAKCVLRFNLKAFRNSYGLADLGRMHLVFHGILVGKTCERSLTMQNEMSGDESNDPPKAAEILDGTNLQEDELLNVFDVLLAGVEYDG